MTYSTLVRDCEHLAAAARRMDAIVSEKSDFRDDPEFQRLLAQFKATMDDVRSLAIAL